ncbi:MAG TPA: MFS transporter [Opitutaceae bacterium]|jgi:DHA2 family methylenomycin A resistance protein-like MFS transporter|nr:MFS transporter [Opitutaceae bacterium]
MSVAATAGPRLRWITAAASVGFVVIQLDVTIVNVALPSIGHSLRTGVSGLQWVVDAYTLTLAAGMLSAGAMGDLWGARRAYVAGFVVFGLASLACGFAPGIGFLNAARAAQGIGAAMALPNSLAILNHAFVHDPKARAKAIGFWTAASAVAIAAGPIAGGLLVGAIGWRSIFFVNVPICVLGVWLAYRVLPETEKGAEHRRLDPAGLVLGAVALTGFTGTIIELREHGLRSPVILGGILLTVVSGACFLLGEARSRSPMLPLHFFKLPTFSACVFFGTLVNLTYYGIIFVIALYLQQVLRYSVIAAGLAFLPLTATFVAANLISAWMAARYGSRRPMILGALIGAAGFLLLRTLGPASPFVAMLAPFMLLPLGMGMAVPAMTTAVLASVDKSWSATASAVLNTARQAGGAVGVAVFGALASGGVERIVPGLGAAAWISAGLLLLGALSALTVRATH